MELMVIWPEQEAEKEQRLKEVLRSALEGIQISRRFGKAEELAEAVRQGALRNCRILFAAALGSTGINLTLYAMLEILRAQPDCLKGSTAGIVVDAESECHTKSLGREIAQTANEAGCWFVGRPLTEGTRSLRNYRVAASNHGCSLYEAYLWSARDLVRRILSFQQPVWNQPKLLCLHSCNPSTSNTLQLWMEVKRHLSGRMEIQEISLRDGTVTDCAGCAYEMCMYFSRNSSCFYGGPIVEEVYPALQKCNGLVLLCPNYNDALSANLTAFVNRLTALFRRKPFADKYLFALIVSGYSGGDILARQLIGGLNMNKSFILPPDFALMETADQPGSIMRIPDIRQKAAEFAANMLSCMRGTDY